MTASQVERQSLAFNLALTRLGPVAAMAFLNSRNDALGGRPIDLAIESDASLERVRRSLAAMPPMT